MSYGVTDQGHLHPKQEVPTATGISRPGIESGGEHFSKSYSNIVLIAIRNI
jgi:hypothetical protein